MICLICVGTHLTLVGTVVPPLDELDLQRPGVGAGRVQDRKPFVVGVHLGSGRQNVPVPPPDPRDLILAGGGWGEKREKREYTHRM